METLKRRTSCLQRLSNQNRLCFVLRLNEIHYAVGQNKNWLAVVYRSNNNANANGGVSYANANNGFTNANTRIGVRLAIITHKIYSSQMEFNFSKYVPTLSDGFTISACRELSHSNSKLRFGKLKNICVVESQVGYNVNCIAELRLFDTLFSDSCK